MKFIIYIVLPILSFAANAGNFRLDWANYNHSQKVELIRSYQEFFIALEREYPLVQSNQKVSSFLKVLSGFHLLNEAWALTEVTYKNMCNYGAWPSHYYRGKKRTCQNPLDTKHYQGLMKYYKSRRSSCKTDHAFLCNPSLTGGVCVGRYPLKNLTKRCMKQSLPIEKIVDEFKKKPELVELFKMNHDLSMKFCTKNKAWFCKDLNNKLKHVELARNNNVSNGEKDAVKLTNEIIRNGGIDVKLDDIQCPGCLTDDSDTTTTNCNPPESNYMADNEFYKSIKPITLDDPNIVSKECIAKVQKMFPGPPVVRYAKCDSPNGKPEYDSVHKPCSSPEYLNAIHSLFNRISLCMGIKPKILFPMLSQESGLHPNAISWSGCLGIGQMGSMLQDIHKNHSWFKSDLDKCGQLANKPYKDFFKFRSNDGKRLKCRLIHGPESLKLNIMTAVMAMKFNMKYVDHLLNDSTSQKIIDNLGMKSYYKIKGQIMILAHNAGSGVVEALDFYVREKKNVTAKDLDLFGNPENAPKGSFLYFLKHNYINTVYTGKKSKKWPWWLNNEDKRKRRNTEVAEYMHNINRFTKFKDKSGKSCSEPKIYSSL
ncbi:MAG: hypothetical protein KAQ98_00955 [Bacteriovoracaceae bacterium]|nr:hypothetical protein [Bacteriovoracaceae bacterium]